MREPFQEAVPGRTAPGPSIVVRGPRDSRNGRQSSARANIDMKRAIDQS